MSGIAGIAQARLGAKNVLKDDSYLGAERSFMDKDHSNPDSVAPLSSRIIRARYVLNDSGGTLDPGKGVVIKSGAPNKIGGYHSANGRCDGVVDPFLVGAVAVNDYFWLIVDGPVDVEIGAGNITANAVVQTIGSGLFAGGTAGTNTVGHSGIAEEAANSGARARVIFNNPFSVAR